MNMNPNAINALRDSLTLQNSLRAALDQKASFLVAIAAAVFAFSVIRMDTLNFQVLAACSFVTLVFAVFVVFLPFRGKRTERFSLLCWWGIKDKDFNQYRTEIKQVLASDETIIEEYTREIWTLTEYSIRPKSRILKWASFVLVLGLLAGFVLSIA